MILSLMWFLKNVINPVQFWKENMIFLDFNLIIYSVEISLYKSINIINFYPYG